jgi:hypothetical protein
MVLSLLQQVTGSLNSLGQVALMLWIPASILFFLYLKPWKAVVLIHVVGFLVLPQGKIYIPALPDLDRNIAMALGSLLGALWVRPPDPWPTFRWIDLPIVLWCSTPLLSSISNDLGLWDGISGGSRELIRIGIPWLLARRFVHGPEEARTLATVFVVAALIHVIPVLYELRMSPQLHKIVYGYHQHSFIQTRRGEGWRPMVFMQHGLGLSLFHAMAAILAVTLCGKSEYQRIERICAFLLLATITALTNSLGAIILFFFGITLWTFCRGKAYGLVIVGSLLILPLYPVTRAVLGWNGAEVLSYFEEIDTKRARSLRIRFEDEELLADKAHERALFGWGGWDRKQVDTMGGKQATAYDSRWIINLSSRGWMGLICRMLIAIIPLWAFSKRFPPWTWRGPLLAPAGGLFIVVLLHELDSLMNSMPSPLTILAMGVLANLASPRQTVKR